MVGLVIASHSRDLAESAVAVAGQMIRGSIPIAAVGGTGDPEQPFGSDAAEIARAILQVHSADGVVVLMDLGSTVMSAEMALELLPEGVRRQVHLCAGPLVEGAIVAAIQASCGSSVETVLREARQALKAKTDRLDPPGD